MPACRLKCIYMDNMRRGLNGIESFNRTMSTPGVVHTFSPTTTEVLSDENTVAPVCSPHWIIRQGNDAVFPSGFGSLAAVHECNACIYQSHRARALKGVIFRFFLCFLSHVCNAKYAEKLWEMPENGRPALAPTGGRHAAGLRQGIFACDLQFSGERLLLWLPVFRKIKMKCLKSLFIS